MAKMTGTQRKALGKIALELQSRISDEPENRSTLECAASYFWDTVRAAFGTDQGVLDVMFERGQMAAGTK